MTQPNPSNVTTAVPANAAYGLDDDSDRWNVFAGGLTYLPEGGAEVTNYPPDDAVAEWGPFRWFDADDNEIQPVDRERVLVEAAEPAIYAEILHRLPTGVEGTDGGGQR